MPRNPKVRVSYNADTAYLLRLQHAVEMDRKRPLVWRQAVISQLQALAQTLMNAPSPGNGGE